MLGLPELLDAVKGLRAGAILNPTSVTEDLRHLADVLHERKVVAANIGGCIAIAGMSLMLMASTVHHTRQLYREERLS